jgi:hypothetical protein
MANSSKASVNDGANTDLLYPSLLKAADAGSGSAQKMHFLLLRTELVLLGVGAAFSVAAVWCGNKEIAAWIAAALLFTSFFISWINKARRYERKWFDCRAVAESVKSLTWRYVTKADPFEKLADDQAARAFVASIGKARAERETSKAALAAQPVQDLEIITARMHQIRMATARERAKVYFRDRLQHQQAWYGQRATAAAQSESRWFWTTSILQAVTMVAAVYVAASKATVSPLSVLTTVVAGATAWARAKRFGDLAQSYRVAEHELAALRGQEPSVDDDAAVAKWVEEVELLISREHMMWFAKSQS